MKCFAKDLGIGLLLKESGIWLCLVEVYRRVEAPVELHVTTPGKFETCYRRFIEPGELIEI